MRSITDELTVAAQWRAQGKADPFHSRFDCTQVELYMGGVSCKEVATRVRWASVARTSQAETLEAARERILWLSRKLAKQHAVLNNEITINRQRNMLAMGELTDDELAMAVSDYGSSTKHGRKITAAASERIVWLSKLVGA
ncbi:hypothetical protein AB4254_11900 [Vibrio breoganii]